MASVNTQFSIAIHVLAALAHYETSFTSEILAGGVNANPVFLKRIMAKLSKAKLVNARVGKVGGYTLTKRPKDISLLDISHAINPPIVFAIHTYKKKSWCIVSSNIKGVMGELQVGMQKAIDDDLRQTTLADVVARIRSKSQ